MFEVFVHLPSFELYAVSLHTSTQLFIIFSFLLIKSFTVYCAFDFVVMLLSLFARGKENVFIIAREHTVNVTLNTFWTICYVAIISNLEVNKVFFLYKTYFVLCY